MREAVSKRVIIGQKKRNSPSISIDLSRIVCHLQLRKETDRFSNVFDHFDPPLNVLSKGDSSLTKNQKQEVSAQALSLAGHGWCDLLAYRRQSKNDF